MVMTQQYLAGELSVLLARLHTVATDEVSARALARLRREAETLPVTALASVATRAMDVIEAVCWDSVTRGDMSAFRCQSVAAAELYEFGVCAGLFADQ
jgi:hypothetical protein